MFNIKLEEKSYKMSFKAVPVKIQWSKKPIGGHIVPGQIGLNTLPYNGTNLWKKTIMHCYTKNLI